MSENNQKTLKFPPGFLWGTSTSAYQIEGGITNDWSAWEKKNAARLAKDAKTYWQPWQQAMFPEMFALANYICGSACDSYHRYEEDFNLATELNNNAVRLGIEWARIEPEQGKFNLTEIEHYRQVLKAAKEKNLKIVLTLWHWTNPVWLAEQGGWTNKKVVGYFSRYCRLIVDHLGDMIDFWVTLNEPMMIIGHGYLDGKFPPNKKFNLIKGFKVFQHFIRAHRDAYKLIHEKFKDSQVGLAVSTACFEPARSWCPAEILIAKTANYFRNQWFLNKVRNYFDYIGINYYHHNRIVWYPPFKKNLNRVVDDRGWEFYPDGIYQILLNYKKYKKPILILENGTADAKDKLRPRYLKEHLRSIHKAIQAGVDVRGYFYWSLLDNFEWAEGYWPKFGLYAVDRKTFRRTPRPSAKVYAEICKNNYIVNRKQTTENRK